MPGRYFDSGGLGYNTADLMDFGVYLSLPVSGFKARMSTRASFHMKFRLIERSELDYWSRAFRRERACHTFTSISSSIISASEDYPG